MNHHAPQEHAGGFFASRWTIRPTALLAVAGIYLIAEHQAHVLGYAPLLLLLACPLMHLFMHGHHRGHHRAPGTSRTPEAGRS